MELSVKTLPACGYAVFTCKGEEIRSGPRFIWKEWLPGSQYKSAHKFLIEVYDEQRFKGMEKPDSELDFWLPVKPRKE